MLISCPSCGKRTTDRVSTCPFCGADVKALLAEAAEAQREAAPPSPDEFAALELPEPTAPAAAPRSSGRDMPFAVESFGKAPAAPEPAAPAYDPGWSDGAEVYDDAVTDEPGDAGAPGATEPPRASHDEPWTDTDDLEQVELKAKVHGIVDLLERQRSRRWIKPEHKRWLRFGGIGLAMLTVLALAIPYFAAFSLLGELAGVGDLRYQDLEAFEPTDEGALQQRVLDDLLGDTAASRRSLSENLAVAFDDPLITKEAIAIVREAYQQVESLPTVDTLTALLPPPGTAPPPPEEIEAILESVGVGGPAAGQVLVLRLGTGVAGLALALLLHLGVNRLRWPAGLRFLAVRLVPFLAAAGAVAAWVGPTLATEAQRAEAERRATFEVIQATAWEQQRLITLRFGVRSFGDDLFDEETHRSPLCRYQTRPFAILLCELREQGSAPPASARPTCPIRTAGDRPFGTLLCELRGAVAAPEAAERGGAGPQLIPKAADTPQTREEAERRRAVQELGELRRHRNAKLLELRQLRRGRAAGLAVPSLGLGLLLGLAFAAGRYGSSLGLGAVRGPTHDDAL